MAAIITRKHKKKTTYYVAYYVDGKLVRRRVGRSYALAQKLKGDIEAKLERKESGLVPKDYDIRKFFDEYLRRTQDQQSAEYYKRNQTVINNFLNFLEKKHPYIAKLSRVTPGVIEDYKIFRRSLLSEDGTHKIKKRTINLEVSSLKTYLNKAVTWDMLNINPLQKVEYVKVDDAKKIRSLTAKEVNRILEKCPTWFYPVVYTALYMGMRQGELIHLEWSDIDFVGKRIRIKQKDGWAPKSSGKSIRERSIPISRFLVDFLKKHKKKTKSKDDNWVFHGPDGKQLKPELRKVLIRVAKKCGINDVTQIHALRHTYATHLVKSGVDLPTVQSMMGHADIRTTMRYAEVFEEHRTKAAEKLEYNDKN
ncbi:MAG: tyrosine-type recombinase/integrase [Planctomycetota bacterium]|mgnify:CR=1 FL=1